MAHTRLVGRKKSHDTATRIVGIKQEKEGGNLQELETNPAETSTAQTAESGVQKEESRKVLKATQLWRREDSDDLLDSPIILGLSANVLKGNRPSIVRQY